MASTGRWDHPNLNLTPEEKPLFARLFKLADTKGDGIVAGEVAISLFPKAKLSENTLGEIWAMADAENRGFLLQEDFVKAMRLIGHFQSNPAQPLSTDMTLQPCPPGFPKFEGINMGPGAPVSSGNAFDHAGTSPAIAHSPQGFPPSQGIPVQNSGSVRVPPLTPDRVADYTRLFDSAGVKPGGTLDGEKARMFFQRSALPNMVLAQVWNLADTEQRSSLSLSEFIIAMHLLASYRNGVISSLPTTLPAGLIEAASRRQTQAQAMPRQFSGQNTARTSSPLARQAFGPPQTVQASEWVIGLPEKQGFDTLFSRLDTHNAGFISAGQAVEFFVKSELPQESLAAIWDLATIRGLDQLNSDEFAVAMYLIRDQRGKARPDLPPRLPTNLVPPSLRGQVKASIAPQPGFAQPLAQPQKPHSAAEDLFGLDALSASPPPPQSIQAVPQQSTGSSPSVSRPFDDPFSAKATSPTVPNYGSSSPRAGTSHFKPFIPSSTFGQGLATQNTGGSGTSSQAPQSARDFRPQPSAMDDLLGDNDESSKKISNDSSELANMSNQIGILRNQMQDVRSKKSTTEAELANTNGQKRDLEQRLSQFRGQYEQEARQAKELEEQLAASRKDTRQIQQDLALLEAGYQDLQTKHRQAAAALDNERRENASLKERIRQINAEVAQLKPQLEQMQKDTRGEKGRVSINKKEVERSEATRDSVKAEIDELSRTTAEASKVPLPNPTSNVASPALSTANATKSNPFFRRSPQQSFDNSMSPGGFSQQLGAPPPQAPSITNIFGPSFGNSPMTSPPATSFRADNYPAESSVTSSSEPGLPTPSASPHPSEAPPPPASRQITSHDLPLSGPRPDTAASSVRVETPTSRISGLETPTNVGSGSPVQSYNDRPFASRHDTQPSTGAAIFDRAASPVASITSNASRGGKSAANQDFFGNFGSSVPGAFPEPTPMEPEKTGESAFSNGSKQVTPFGFPGRQDTNPKSDFDSAFASVGGPKGINRQVTGSSQGEGSAAPKPRFDPEFPPIETIEPDESDSDEDAHGFGDSFTQASPPRQKHQHEPREAVGGSSFFGSQPPASELPRPDAQMSPPSYNTAAGPRIGSQDFPQEFGGLLPSRENPLSSPSLEAQSPSVGTRGDALFGGSSTASKSVSAAPTSTFSGFSGSPPPTTGTPASTTGTHSDAFHSAPTHPNTERDSSSTQKSHGGFNDDFDSGFDDLAEAKDNDDADDDFVFGSQHHNQQDDDWNPHFDSPTTSKAGTMQSERTPTAGQSISASKSIGFDDFNDFGSSFKPLSQSTLIGSTAKDTNQQPLGDEWEDMFSSIGGSSTAKDKSLSGFDENEPFGSGSASGPPLAAPMPPPLPEAPEAPPPPKLGRTVTESSVHDVDDVKKLVKMGYPRPLAVNALERFDYDFGKALEHLSGRG